MKKGPGLFEFLEEGNVIPYAPSIGSLKLMIYEMERNMGNNIYIHPSIVKIERQG